MSKASSQSSQSDKRPLSTRDENEASKTAVVKELVCSEIWGGNQAGSNSIHLTNLDGIVHAAPCAQAHEGGDVYYLGACSGGLTGRLCLADVVGHGDEVAEVSKWFHQVLRKRMNRINPAAIFNEVNRRVCERGLGAMTTAVCMSFDAIRSELHYACAGHPPALLYDASAQQWRPLKVEDTKAARIRRPGAAAKTCNLPLGVLEDTVYTVSRHLLGPGDRIFLYSDGLLEAPGEADAQFGMENLMALLHQHHRQSGEALLRSVFAALRRHTGLDYFMHDDMTMMLFEAGSPKNGPRIVHFVRNNWRKWLWRRSTTT